MALFAMDELAKGLTFCDTRKSRWYHDKALMYLDDNTNYSNDFVKWLAQPPSALENLERLRHDAQTWERLLWTTGGLLKLPKCLYYLIQWTFDQEGVPRMLKAAELPQLRLTSGRAPTPKPIQHLDHDQPHRTLGCRIATGFHPDKCSTATKTASTHATYLQETADAYATGLAQTSVTQKQASMGYHGIFLPRMTFGLGVCPISKKKLIKIQKRTKKVTLHKLGFMASTPNAVVYGALQHGGLGLRHLYIERGIAQTILLIRHVRANSDQGTMVRIALDWWQQSAGVNFPLLLNPAVPVPYLESNWLTSLRDFLRDIKGSLQISAQDTDTPPRRGDQKIMMVILPSSTTRADMIKFNRCREFLQVKWLSEITSANGLTISREAWKGVRHRHTSELWPVQTNPGPTHWRVWRRTLANTLLRQCPSRCTPTTRDLTLRTAYQTSVWTQSSQWLRTYWKYSRSRTSDQLYSRGPDGSYYVHPRHKRSRTGLTIYRLHTQTTTNQLPADALPADAVRRGNTISCESNSHMSIEQPPTTRTPPEETPHSQWRRHIASLPTWEHLLLRTATFSSVAQLRTLLGSDQTIIVCSDGGAKDGAGSFGTVIALECENDEHHGIVTELQGQAFGPEPGSFRAEAYGMLAGLRLLLQACNLWNIQSQADIQIFCDNEGLIKRMNKRVTRDIILPRHFLIPEADLEMLIDNSLKALGLASRYTHVKGHQDKGLSPEELRALPQPTQLNIRCDQLASDQLERTLPIPSVPFAEETAVTLDVDGHSITHHVPSQIRNAYGRRLQRKYLTKRYHWQHNEFDWVHWHIVRRSLLKFGQSRRNFLIKRQNLITPLMHRRFRYTLETTDKCPSCRHHSETDYHFLRCPHEHRRQLLEDIVPELLQLCKKHKIDPGIKTALRFLLASLRNPEATFPEPDSIYGKLISDQLQIGPDSFMSGMFHTEWVNVQDDYRRLIKAKRGKNQAFSGIRSIATLFMDTQHQIWLMRNGHLHDDEGLHSYKRYQLLRELQWMYNQQPKMLSTDRDIFRGIDFSAWENVPTNRIKSFVQKNKPIIQRSIQDAIDLSRTPRTIRHYFSVPPPPTHLYSQPEPD